VKTAQHPVPSGRAALKLGKALRKVAVIGTGGMSHALQGERAGLIDFDLECMDRIASDPE
jgi:protocatechuate 4,5-dioxygenase beta chain